MDFSYLDKAEYKDIKMYNICKSNSEDLPFFIRKYNALFGNNSTLHRHEYIQIIYVYKGQAIHFINNIETKISKGDIFIIPPFIPHKIYTDSEELSEIFEFEFDIDYVLQNQNTIDDSVAYLDFAYLEPFLVTEGFVKPRFNLSGKTKEIVEDMLNEALNEYNKKEPSYVLIIKAILLKLLVIIGREYNKEPKELEIGNVYNNCKNAISDAVKYINENYGNDITVKDVSSKISYSQSHFSYLFKCITGMTFIEYLHNLRINKAMELLKTTDLRIIDISYEVGFNNIQHFNKIFKSFVGLSPRVFRNKKN